MKKHEAKYNIQIHYRITADEFLRRVKEEPMSIFSDYDVRYGIERLREICQKRDKKDIELSKKILTQAGLSAFIPKEAQERTTENERLRYWKQRPYQFFQEIEYLKTRIKPSLKKQYKLNELDKKKEDIKAAYKRIYGQDLSEKALKELTSGERDKDVTAVALSIFAHWFGIPFEALKKFYYRVSKKEKQRQASPKPMYLDEFIKLGKKDKEYRRHVLNKITIPEIFKKEKNHLLHYFF